MEPNPSCPPPPPSFARVPLRARRDGWTAERQAAFIDALAATRHVGRACARVGMSRESAYRLYGRPDAASFRAAWDACLAMAPVPPLPPADAASAGPPHRRSNPARPAAAVPPLGNPQLPQHCQLPAALAARVPGPPTC